MNIWLGEGSESWHIIKKSDFNEVACRPGIFIELLEQRLGLGDIRLSKGRRIAAYQDALYHYRIQNEDCFYSRSFLTAPWAVAETLLDWRDILRMGGWNGQLKELGSDRLDCLAVIEELFPSEFRSSEGDRLHRVILALEHLNPGEMHIQSIDPESWYQEMWKRLLTHLNTTFVEPDFPLSDKSDLGHLKEVLAGQKEHFDYKNDGSITLVSAYSESLLAKAGAHFLANTKGSSVLIQGENLHLLDSSIRQTNQPSLGTGSISKHRPIPQLLGMTLSMRWKPFDPRLMRDFLLHPESPVNSGLRFRLAKALDQYPGMGNLLWNDAIVSSRQSIDEKFKNDETARKKALKQLESNLKIWIQFEFLDPENVSSQSLLEVGKQISKWAANRSKTKPQKQSEYGQLRQLAKDFCSIIETRPSSNRIEVDQVIRCLMGQGQTNLTSTTELGHIPVLSSAGMNRPVDTVFWWDFSEPTSNTRQVFNPKEIEILQQNGIHITTTIEKTEKQRDVHHRPVLCTKKKLILFKPLQRAGDGLADHRIYTRLLAATANSTIQPLPTDIDSWLSHASSGGPVQLVSIKKRPLTARKRWLHLPKKLNLSPRTTESYSSLNKWMTSPFDYVCHYVAKLKPGFFRDHRLTIDPRLKGNLIHRLTELMFSQESTSFDWKHAKEKHISEWLNDRWNTLVEQEAANLYLPGNRDSEIQLKSMAKQTLMDLVMLLQQIKATKVIADHQPTAIPFGNAGSELTGKVDLYAISKKSELVLIDLKFGGRAVRANEIEDGRALQLAVYGRLITQGAWQESIKSAYYIISSNHWISKDVDVFKHSSEYNAHADYMEGTWDKFMDIWQWRQRQIEQGEIEVLYQGTDKEASIQAPHDKWISDFCDEAYSPYVALSGWKENA